MQVRLDKPAPNPCLDEVNKYFKNFFLHLCEKIRGLAKSCSKYGQIVEAIGVVALSLELKNDVWVFIRVNNPILLI